MNNFEFLRKYEQLQSGIMFDKILDLEFATIGFCENDSGSFWNRALVNSKINKKQLNKIEKAMENLARTPTLYFENKNSLKPLIRFLKENGYKLDFEDSWMFWGAQAINKDNFSKVKKVNNGKDLEIFIECFDKCYQKNDPQNPYGELGAYLDVAKDAWLKNNNIPIKLEYYIAYKSNNPVAVASLTNYLGIGYISNVGSLQKVRGGGFGKLITLYCVEQSKRYGNKEHCLATEEGDYPNEFYKRIGFKTRFTGVSYTKNNK